MKLGNYCIVETVAPKLHFLPGRGVYKKMYLIKKNIYCM